MLKGKQLEDSVPKGPKRVMDCNKDLTPPRDFDKF